MRKLLTEIGRHVLPPASIRVARGYAQRLVPSLVRTGSGESLHLRTEQELELRGRGLSEVTGILNGLDIPYFLSGGTLLGIVREGDFIRWDNDVDIDSPMELVRPRQRALLGELEAAGFEITKLDLSRTDFLVGAAKYGTRYEIVGYLKMGRMRYRRRSRYPDDFLDRVSEVELRGGTYSTFGVPERYLEWFYGDWRTPIRAAGAYVTDRSRTGPISLSLMEIVSLLRDR